MTENKYISLQFTSNDRKLILKTMKYNYKSLKYVLNELRTQLYKIENFNFIKINKQHILIALKQKYTEFSSLYSYTYMWTPENNYSPRSGL